MTATSTNKTFEKLGFMFKVYRKLMKRFLILRQVSYRMTIILFTVFAGNARSAVNPLPEDYLNIFYGDPITDDMKTS